LPKLRFFDILLVLRLDLGQIRFSLVGSAFAFLFAAVISLLPGLRGVEKCLRKSYRTGQSLPWSSQV